METARGFLPEQRRMVYQMMLMLAVAALVTRLLHKPVQFMIGMLIIGWGVSILTQERPGYLAQTRGVLVMGVLYYVLYRFVFPDL